MKELIAELRPPEVIRNFMDIHEDWAQHRARQLGIVAKYVTTQTLLHLPYYDPSDIVNSGEDVLKEVDVKVVSLGEDYERAYNRLYSDTDLSLVSAESMLKGRNILAVHDESSIIPVSFREVTDYTAEEINNRLHYIRSSRNDSIANYGLYIDTSETPYASVSFSRCTRGYQVDALNQATGLRLLPEQVLSMTRAFTFNNAPKNSMSKLFHQAHRQINLQFPEVRAIVTALNPYTGFDGGIFTGASYRPYALSPMEYWYDDHGFYVPRSKGIHAQKTETPHIIWLAHGMDRTSANLIDITEVNKIKVISADEYKNG